MLAASIIVVRAIFVSNTIIRVGGDLASSANTLLAQLCREVCAMLAETPNYYGNLDCKTPMMATSTDDRQDLLA
jgi:hypothetical protein